MELLQLFFQAVDLSIYPARLHLPQDGYLVQQLVALAMSFNV